MQLRLGAIPKDQAVRSLALSTLINPIGNGLFMTVDVIYFTTIIGLTPGHVAIGLTIAGGIGVLANIPAGHLSDRLSPRELAVVATCLQGLTIGLFIFVHSFPLFLAHSLSPRIRTYVKSVCVCVYGNKFFVFF